MTRLSKRKTRLVITTEDLVRERRKLREVVIEAHPHHAEVRLLGLRKSYAVTWSGIYSLAVKRAVEQERAAKKAAKKEKRRG
jgi:hypothetical protein